MLVLALLTACGGGTGLRPDPAAQHLVVLEALGQVGRPYRFGGTTPDGFDCSGLVQYVYPSAGPERSALCRVPSAVRLQSAAELSHFRHQIVICRL